MHTPAEVAQLLGIAPPTLRRWSSDLAALLSTQARRPGAAGRRYSDDDLDLLRRYQSLIKAGSTYEQARARLLVEQRSDGQQEAQRVEVEIIQPDDQQQTLIVLIEQARALIENQRSHIADQQALIVQLQADAELVRENYQAERETWKEQRDFLEAERVRVDSQLEQAKADEAAALADMRRMLDKIPRWLRGLLGLGA